MWNAVGQVLPAANPKNPLLAVSEATTIALTAMSVLCLVIGVKLIGQGMAGF